MQHCINQRLPRVFLIEESTSIERRKRSFGAMLAPPLQGSRATTMAMPPRGNCLVRATKP